MRFGSRSWIFTISKWEKLSGTGLCTQLYCYFQIISRARLIVGYDLVRKVYWRGLMFLICFYFFLCALCWWILIQQVEMYAFDRVDHLILEGGFVSIFWSADLSSRRIVGFWLLIWFRNWIFLNIHICMYRFSQFIN